MSKTVVNGEVVTRNVVVGVQGPPGAPGSDGSDGAPGVDGREVELQKNPTHIQWRHEGEAGWTNLVPLTDITGPPGASDYLDLTNQPFFNVKAFGAVGDGVTDDTAAIQAAIQAAYDAGGGTVYFPRGVYRCDSQLVFPHDGATPRALQPPIKLLGDAGEWNGNLADATDQHLEGSVLDLRAATAPAKLDTRGLGLLTLEGLTLTDQGTSSVPFIHTTNTTLHVRGCAFVGNPTKSGATCDQDAIVLGGTGAISSNAADGAFAGYGTVIDGCFFHRIRRGVYGRSRCNSVVVMNNLWTSLCGADATAAAVEFDGTGSENQANAVAFNTIEGTEYVYIFKCVDASFNIFLHNQVWDTDTTTLAVLRCEGASCNLNEIDGIFLGSLTKDKLLSLDASAGGQVVREGKTFHDGLVMAGGVDKNYVRPYQAVGAENAKLFAVYRSLQEATDPGSVIWYVRQDGLMEATGANAAMKFGTVGYFGTVGTTTLKVARYTAGDIDLSPASGGRVRVTTGVFSLPAYTVATLPSAATAGIGAMIYVSDESGGAVPAFSDGTNWLRSTDRAVVS